MTLRDLIQALRDTYCGTIGFEYMFITRPRAEALDPGAPRAGARARRSFAPEQQKHLLEQLTAAETLERYLHTRYVGQKRFSLEGGESLIPRSTT